MVVVAPHGRIKMAANNQLERRKCIVQAGEILKEFGKAAAVSHLTKLGFAAIEF